MNYHQSSDEVEQWNHQKDEYHPSREGGDFQGAPLPNHFEVEACLPCLNDHPDFVKIIFAHRTAQMAPGDLSANQNQATIFIPLTKSAQVPGSSSSHERVTGLVNHSEFYKRLVDIRTYEKEEAMKNFREINESQSRSDPVNSFELRMKYEQACLEQCKKMNRVFCQPVVNLSEKFEDINQIRARVKQAVIADLKTRGEYSPEKVSFDLSEASDSDQDASIRLNVLQLLLQKIKYDTLVIPDFQNSQTGVGLQLEKASLRFLEDLLSISFFLKLKDLETTIIHQHLIPSLTPGNVLRYTKFALIHLQMSSSKQDLYQECIIENQVSDHGQYYDDLEYESQNSMGKEHEAWMELYKECQTYLVNHLLTILTKEENHFLELQHFVDPLKSSGEEEQTSIEDLMYDTLRERLKQANNICERILFTAIYKNWQSSTYSFMEVFSTLVKVKGLKSIFQLLEQERGKAFSDYWEMLDKLDHTLRPSHTWKLGQLSRGSLIQDHPFMSRDAVWKMGITYSTAEQLMKVNLNFLANPLKADKNAKMYFKKSEFFLRSNILTSSLGCQPVELLPSDFDQRSEGEQKILTELKTSMDRIINQYPEHMVLSVLTSVRMREKEFEMPKMSSLIVAQKSPVIIQEIHGFNPTGENDFQKRTGSQLVIGIYVKISKVISALLFALSRNFYKVFRDPFIYLLEDSDFRTILKHKRLNVSCEEEIVGGLNFWLQDPSRSIESIDLVVREIQWKFVPLLFLIELNRSHPKIRESTEFKKVLGNELQYRLALASAAQSKAINNIERFIKDLQHPRFCYKQARVQNMIVTDFARDELECLPIYMDLPEVSKYAINQHINFMQDFINIQLGYGQPLLPPSPVADFKMQLALCSSNKPPTQKQQDELRAKLTSIVLEKQNEIKQLMEQLHMLGLDNTQQSIRREQEEKRELQKKSQAEEIENLKFNLEREKILNDMKTLKVQNDQQQEILRLRQEQVMHQMAPKTSTREFSSQTAWVKETVTRSTSCTYLLQKVEVEEKVSKVQLSASVPVQAEEQSAKQNPVIDLAKLFDQMKEHQRQEKQELLKEVKEIQVAQKEHKQQLQENAQQKMQPVVKAVAPPPDRHQIKEDDGSPEWEDVLLRPAKPSLRSKLVRSFGLSRKTQLRIGRLIRRRGLSKQGASIRLMSILLDHFENLKQKESSLYAKAKKDKMKQALYRRLNPKPEPADSEKIIEEESGPEMATIQNPKSAQAPLSLSKLGKLVSIEPKKEMPELSQPTEPSTATKPSTHDRGSLCTLITESMFEVLNNNLEELREEMAAKGEENLGGAPDENPADMKARELFRGAHNTITTQAHTSKQKTRQRSLDENMRAGLMEASTMSPMVAESGLHGGSIGEPCFLNSQAIENSIFNLNQELKEMSRVLASPEQNDMALISQLKSPPAAPVLTTAPVTEHRPPKKIDTLPNFEGRVLSSEFAQKNPPEGSMDGEDFRGYHFLNRDISSGGMGQPKQRIQISQAPDHFENYNLDYPGLQMVQSSEDEDIVQIAENQLQAIRGQFGGEMMGHEMHKGPHHQRSGVLGTSALNDSIRLQQAALSRFGTSLPTTSVAEANLNPKIQLQNYVNDLKWEMAGQQRNNEIAHHQVKPSTVPYPVSSFATQGASQPRLDHLASIQNKPLQFPTVPNQRGLHQINLDAPIPGMNRPHYQHQQSSILEMHKRPQSDVMSNDMFGDAYLDNKEIDASKPPIIKSPQVNLNDLRSVQPDGRFALLTPQTALQTNTEIGRQQKRLRSSKGSERNILASKGATKTKPKQKSSKVISVQSVLGTKKPKKQFNFEFVKDDSSKSKAK